jgi:hypothetical protein
MHTRRLGWVDEGKRRLSELPLQEMHISSSRMVSTLPKGKRYRSPYSIRFISILQYICDARPLGSFVCITIHTMPTKFNKSLLEPRKTPWYLLAHISIIHIIPSPFRNPWVSDDAFRLFVDVVFSQCIHPIKE